ncbi:MAG: hypothetical protein KGP27_07575 [Hyphomicrobiales bacterium]|nr:hypothetical protein [Hyphomicrobiales bacterium]
MSNRLKIKDTQTLNPVAHQPTVFAASPHGHAMAAVVIVMPLTAAASRLSRPMRLRPDERPAAVAQPTSCDRAA